MATNTTKLALSKPDGTDLVDIAVLNGNFDKIDAASGATICTSTTRPASPWNGQVIFETDTLNALVYRTSTTSWNILGGSTVASAPPSGAGNGNFWWDSDNGKLYIYYNDGNSGQWVSVMPSQTTVDVSQNYIINGGFDVWQRGTSVATGAFTYRADRWIVDQAVTVSRSTDVPAGIEAGYSMLIPAGTSAATARQAIELPGTSVAGNFSEGETFTLSFYAKATASRDLNVSATFRNGIVGTNYLTVLNAVPVGTATSSWSRFSSTFTIPAGSITGANCFPVVITAAAGSSADVYFTGVQLEKGSVATSFKRAAGTLQGELAACQRYYYQASGQTHYGALIATNDTGRYTTVFLPASMRSAITSGDVAMTSGSGTAIWDKGTMNSFSVYWNVGATTSWVYLTSWSVNKEL